MPELHVDVLGDLPGWRHRTVKPAVVEEYAEAMERGDEFPPLVAFRARDGDGDSDNEHYWLVDGRHRRGAARRLGRETVDVEVQDGTLKDAIFYACGTNAAHGLPRTNDDKRRAVQVMLRDAEWGQWSNREIARRCRVSETLVRRVRDGLTANKTQSESRERRYSTRHGTVATMQTENIGNAGRRVGTGGNSISQPCSTEDGAGNGASLVRAGRLEELKDCWRAAGDSERRQFVAWIRDEFPDALGFPAPDSGAVRPIRRRARSDP